MTRLQKVLLPMVAVIAFAALGLSIAGLTKTDKPDNDSAVQTRVATLDTEIKGLKVQVDTLNVSTNVSKLGDALHKLYVCLPELQSEVGGLSVQQSTQNGYVTNAYITNPTIVSQDCNRILFSR